MLMKRNDGDLPVPFEPGEGLAEERITRARAIKLAGAMGAAGAFALFTGGAAEAGERDRRRRRRRLRRRRIRQRRNNITTNTDNSTIDFGDVDLGDLLNLPVERVEVFNNGETPVTLNPTVVGRGFTLVDDAPITIGAGESEFVDVTVTRLLTDGAAGQLKLVDARDNVVLETVDLLADVLG
jgi:hypothetical protein